MSVSDKSREELCLSNVSQNRQSFSDRNCDDLCEEILQYLSLEDKLKLEGVSKQFQRTVLKKHYELSIEYVYWIPNKYVKDLFIENISINLKSLKLLLKKCPNITSIKLEDDDPRSQFDFNGVFRLISKYCNNLRQIDFWGIDISDENIEEFQRKFGPKINFFHRLKDANNYNFNLFPNIQKLKVYSKSIDLIPRLNLNNLKQFMIVLEDGEEYMIQTCVDTFPTLTHFSVTSFCKNENSFFKSLQFISNLKNLKHFCFEIVFCENNKLICDSLKRMANKCQKLKSIKSYFHITESSDIIQLLSAIKAFPALKRLDLRLYGKFDSNVIKDLFSFKGLSNITHLTLCWNSTLKVSILKDIDINLPNIQYLFLETYSSKV